MGSQVAQGLVRANCVVDFFPSPQLAVEFVHFQRARGELVELFGMGAVGRAVEFGGTRWQHEQVKAALLAGLLKLGRVARPFDNHV